MDRKAICLPSAPCQGARAEQNYERQRQADQFKINARQRELVLALATDFPRLWNDPAIANHERKRMVRLLIEDITIRNGEQIRLDVRFRGGAARTLMLPRPLSFCESHKQNPAALILCGGSFLEKMEKERLSSFTTSDLLILDSIQREIPLGGELQARVPHLLEQGIIERIGRGRDLV